MSLNRGNSQFSLGPHPCSIFCPMHLLDLNEDVLSTIVECVDKASLLQLSVTCRQTYDLAVPRLVSRVKLDRDARQLKDFCRFMLRTVSIRQKMRSEYLRELVIEKGALRCRGSLVGFKASPTAGTFFYSSLEFDVGEALADLLEHAKNLEFIHFASAEIILVTDPRILRALANNGGNILRVSLLEAGGLSQAVLRRLQGLRELSISAEDVSGVLASIRHMETSLEALRVTRLDRGRRGVSLTGVTDGSIRQVEDYKTLEIADRVEFARLNCLELRQVTLRRSTLVDAFPNIHHLRMCQVQITDEPEPGLKSSSSWSNLDSVHADYSTLSRIPLVPSSAVRQVHLDLTVSPAPDYKLESANTIKPDVFSCLYQLNPPALRISIGPHTPSNTEFWEGLTSAVPQLTALHVELVDFDATTRSQAMGSLFPSIRNLPLVYLSLGLDESGGVAYPDIVVHQIILSTLVKEVIHSLKHVAIHCVYGSWWWGVDDQRSLHRLSSDVGTYLRRQYSLS